MTVYFKTEITVNQNCHRKCQHSPEKHKVKNPKYLCLVVTDNIKKKIPLHDLTSDTYMIHMNKTKIRLSLSTLRGRRRQKQNEKKTALN